MRCGIAFNAADIFGDRKIGTIIEWELIEMRSQMTENGTLHLKRVAHPSRATSFHTIICSIRTCSCDLHVSIDVVHIASFKLLLSLLLSKCQLLIFLTFMSTTQLSTVHSTKFFITLLSKVALTHTSFGPFKINPGAFGLIDRFVWAGVKARLNSADQTNKLWCT